MTEYYTPTRVFLGKKAEEKKGEILSDMGVKKVLLHYGKGSVITSGLLEKIEKDLKNYHIDYVLFGGVQPNPRVSLVREGIALSQKENVDFILAVGGGSVIDSAKAIGYGLYNTEGDIWSYYLKERDVKGSIPIGVVLTLSATGSEMSDSSVISNEEGIGYKRGINSNFSRPVVAFLNPELTYSVSSYQTACGSVDILMHTLERFFHKGDSLELTDELSFALLRTVIKYAPIAIENPTNYIARANLMWAGSLSHNGLLNQGNDDRGDWACHQMEHELSALTDCAHGAGLAVIWPYWAHYTYHFNPERFNTLSHGLFGNYDGEKAIDTLSSFFSSLGMPSTLKELGVNEEDKEKLALNTTFQDKRTIGSFVTLSTLDILNILRSAK